MGRTLSQIPTGMPIKRQHRDFGAGLLEAFVFRSDAVRPYGKFCQCVVSLPIGLCIANGAGRAVCSRKGSIGNGGLGWIQDLSGNFVSSLRLRMCWWGRANETQQD